MGLVGGFYIGIWVQNLGQVYDFGRNTPIGAKSIHGGNKSVWVYDIEIKMLGFGKRIGFGRRWVRDARFWEYLGNQMSLGEEVERERSIPCGRGSLRGTLDQMGR
ncbi:hypothetical protein Acr_01g0005120 [Actinidia rufa]|uniref:Uncharacterized protein n=1 Tax=Actinidia rufa TaxID=165716 RepID=A0A7J0E2F3_9ERIC|nr:hypothetical protein Acr_01g0005120 [Actinidia rufa]